MSFRLPGFRIGHWRFKLWGVHILESVWLKVQGVEFGFFPSGKMKSLGLLGTAFRVHNWECR